LHASITSFAYDIPSIGLTWNFKVPYFYESVGHGERALDHTHWNALEVVDALETALAQGVRKDEAFLMSVYETLFTGLKSIFVPDSTRTPHSYDDLRTAIPAYAGTTPAMYREKMTRKLRRTYESYYQISTRPRTPKPTPQKSASFLRRAYRRVRRAFAGPR
jgi:hypothetical protein